VQKAALEILAQGAEAPGVQTKEKIDLMRQLEKEQHDHAKTRTALFALMQQIDDMKEAVDEHLQNPEEKP